MGLPSTHSERASSGWRARLNDAVESHNFSGKGRVRRPFAACHYLPFGSARRDVVTPKDPHGAVFVRRLPRVGIEGREREAVGRFVVHGHETLTGAHDGGDESARFRSASTRFDDDPLVGRNIERAGVARVQLHVRIR
jgi:hypothetical protein